VNTVIISSLPIIIKRLKTTLLTSGRLAKLLMGPTLPRPGPIPAIQVAAELEAVTGSTPVMTIITVPSTKMNRYNTTNERIEKGSISTFLMMEEPVVENPEVDSKNASINEGIVPLIRYGNVPNNEKIIHDEVTARNPSLLLKFFESASLEIK
jgi:hypothetical protein